MISLAQSETALMTKLITKNFPSHPPGCKRRMPNKHIVVTYLDNELVEKSRELGFNLSKTFENHMKQLLTQFSQVNSSKDSKDNGSSGDWWAGPDSNPNGVKSHNS